MLKVFGFVRRNDKLTHDEYRAAHVGHHNSYGRRLRNIRGYVLNVRANRPVSESLGPLAEELSRGEPAGFDEAWDGWGQLMFDDLEDYIAAKQPARDRAGPTGLEEDPLVGDVGGDGPYLYSGSPFQFEVEEHVVREVLRPERKVFKLIHFARARRDIDAGDLRARWTGDYARELGRLPGLHGCVVNFRTPLDVMTGFFEPEAEAFTPKGARRREDFFEAWDGITELWFDGPEDYQAARSGTDLNSRLTALEDELFEAQWFREVDETIVVMPNRGPAPEFYYR